MNPGSVASLCAHFTGADLALALAWCCKWAERVSAAMLKGVFSHGIELENQEDGILVRQGARAYLARNWQLTAQVVELVDTALENGLICMIRDWHPRPGNWWPNKDGVVHLSFSYASEQHWAVAIDSFKPKTGDFGHAVFHGRLYEQFVDYGISSKQEARNREAKHRIVERAQVLETIRRLQGFDRSVLDR